MIKYYFEAWEGEKRRLIELTSPEVNKTIRMYGARKFLDGLMKINKNPNITKACLLKEEDPKRHNHFDKYEVLAKWNSLSQLETKEVK